LQRRQRSNVHPIVSGAIQQAATGVFMFLPASLVERFPAHVALRPGLAVIYLVLFGSVVGYSSFVYAMDKLPVAIVSIYTYVNPMVAVFLGWLFYREPFGIRELIAMAVIFAGIAIVKFSAKQSIPMETSEA